MTHPKTRRLYWRKDVYMRAKYRSRAFKRWVASLKPTFRILHRITGLDKPTALDRVQVKLGFMPCVVVQGDAKIYPIFEESFTLYAFLEKVEPCEGTDWTSIYAAAGMFPSQVISTQTPERHTLTIEEIMGRVALPADIHDRKRGEDTPILGTICKQRFYRFHMFFHPSANCEKRYAIIDGMWNQYGHKETIDQFPELKLPAEELPSVNLGFASKSKATQATNPTFLADLENFLKESSSPFLNPNRFKAFKPQP